MSRLMSVALTEQAVRDRTKTVTRRCGWRFLQPGDRLTLCRKVQGRRNGEPLVRLAEVEVVNVREEWLAEITPEEVEREGFQGWTPEQFVTFFCKHMAVDRGAGVNRIQWRYLDCRMCNGSQLIHNGMGAGPCPACDVDGRPVAGWEPHYYHGEA